MVLIWFYVCESTWTYFVFAQIDLWKVMWMRFGFKNLHNFFGVVGL